MPQLILDLPQKILDELALIATEAKDPRFTNAKGMIELRLQLEVKSRLVEAAVQIARQKAETTL